VQLEIPLEATRRAMEIARRAGAKVILDPAPARDVEDYFYLNSHVVTPNETEASILSGVEVTDLRTAREAAAVIRRRGARTVAVTLGEKGTLLSSDSGVLHFPPSRVKAVDTTAAGDAFAGALAVFLGEGRPLEEAVRLAGAAGALCATRLGAQPSLPSRKEIDEFVSSSPPPKPVSVL
ncbi:MAG: PfkB family carbohydrate kinase, partial [bacterium]